MIKIINKFKTLIIIFGLGITTALSSWFFFRNQDNQLNNNRLPLDFVEHLKLAEEIDNINTKNIQGAIIPHHNIAEFFAAHLFSQLPERINHVILIAPNHQNIGSHDFVVNSSEIKTSFGTLCPSQWAVKLETYNWIGNDPEIIRQEHAIGNIIDYINYYLPQARLTALVLKRYPSENHLNQLEKLLIDQINSQTIIVGSVDFSHYLTPEQAEYNDQISFQMIENMQTNGWFDLDETYLDSPAAVFLLISAMKSTNNQPRLIKQSNSARVLYEFTPNTTTYQYWVFD